MPPVPKRIPNPIKAWHGTQSQPFRQFEDKHVGKNWGQYWGRGHYFGGARSVGEHWVSPWERAATQRGLATLRERDPVTSEFLDSLRGHLYQVNLHARPELLDFSQPLSKQSPEVQRTIEQLMSKWGGRLPLRNVGPETGGDNFYWSLANALAGPKGGNKFGEFNASNALRARGIPGHSYLGERYDPADAHIPNYVIYPGATDLIEPTHIDDIPIGEWQSRTGRTLKMFPWLAGGAAASQLFPESAEAQESPMPTSSFSFGSMLDALQQHAQSKRAELREITKQDTEYQRKVKQAASQPGRDQYQSTMQAYRPDTLADIMSLGGLLVPAQRGRGTRPVLDIPGTDRALDLFNTLGVASDLIEPGAKGAAGALGRSLAVLLAPGWVRNPVRAARPGEARAYVGSATVPGKRMPVRMAGNFTLSPHSGSAPRGSVWNLGWLGAQATTTIDDFERGPKGSMWGPGTQGLGRQGLMELFERFQQDEPLARWVKWHRAGGRAPFGDVSEGIDLATGRFINPKHAQRPAGDPRFERYREYMDKVYGVTVQPGGLTSRNIIDPDEF